MRTHRMTVVALLSCACSSSSAAGGATSFAGTWLCSGTETTGGQSVSYAETDTITESGSTLSVAISIADAGVSCTVTGTVAGDVATISNQTCSGFTIQSGSFTLSSGTLAVQATGSVNGGTATSKATCTAK